jgi:hypothetical protein
MELRLQIGIAQGLMRGSGGGATRKPLGRWAMSHLTARLMTTAANEILLWSRIKCGE